MEVLLVLVILVVLASMAVTIFGGTQEARSRTRPRARSASSRPPSTFTSSTPRIIPQSLRTSSISRATAKSPALGRALHGSQDAEGSLGLTNTNSPPHGKHNSDSFDIWSTGPDGQDGTEDDIGNWE